MRRYLSSSDNNAKSQLASDEVEQISENLFFVAASPAMRKLRTQIEVLAQVNVPVLIVGESGSGKEVAARLIHKVSARSAFQFLRVNCAALPGDLLQSELFGYERGAFTGAERTKAGKFELCQNGTILLDEFAEMPTGQQTKLLHVLRDKQFFRLSGETTINVDVRILAATNVNIEQALAEKKLREDLHHRLSAFTVHVPPLRERRDEIPLLLGNFMNRLARHYGLPPRVFSPAVLDACQRYPWPGNLRELENFVKRYLLTGGDGLALNELNTNLNGTFGEVNLSKSSESLTAPESESSQSEEHTSSLKSLASAKGIAERNAIAVALTQTRWNRKAAARLLLISYRALLYKIQQYDLSPPEYSSRHLGASAPEVVTKGANPNG
jgi:two-component system, NtrC family, response regulator AtoC